jgi:general secretion pathway protein K
MPKRRDHERGIALVVVLWLLALIAVLLLGFSRDARTELQIARNQEGSARARTIADAGITFAILGALDPSSQTRWHADGQPHALRYASGSIQASVQDEGGKIDLNNAPAEMFAGLFRTLGASAADAQEIADGIIARRKALSPSGGNDNNNGQIPALVEVAQPRRQEAQPFLAIDDLRLVQGVTPALFELVRPFVTVYAKRAQVNPLTAPAEVLRSLPGGNAAEVAAYIAERDSPGTTDAPPIPAGINDAVIGPLEVFTATAQATTASGARFTREAIVAVSGTSGAPVEFLSWRQGQGGAN